jgi:DNA-binding winged helix-turn-helix (wHTH) protein
MQALSCSNYRFDNFELDVVRRRLLRDGRSVTLNPKAFDMLRVLVEHNGILVTKEDLFRLV